MEIIRGAGSVLYGSNAYTGVINIITKTNQENTEIKATARYGSFGTWQGTLLVAKRIGKFNIQAAWQTEKSEGWNWQTRGETDMKLVNGKETVVNPPKSIKMAYESQTYWIKAEYRGFKIQSFGVSRINNNMNAGGGSWGNPIYSGSFNSNYYSDLSYQKQWKEKWDFQLNLNHSYGIRQNLIESKTNPSTNDVMYYAWLAESSLRYQLTTKVSILGGGTTIYMFDNVLSASRLKDGSAFNVYGTKTNLTPFSQVDNESETWYTGYFQLDYQPFPFLKIDMGGQLNKTSAPKANFVPRLNFVFNHKEKFFVKLLYGEAFRSPSLQERYNSYRMIHSSFPATLIGGGENIVPEKIRTTEIQVAYKGKIFQLSTTYFNSHQTDLLARSLPKDSLVVATAGNIGQKLASPKQINNGEFDSQGLELEGRITFFKKFYFTTSFSWLKIGIANDTKTQLTLGMPNTMLKTGLIYEEPKLGFTAGIFNSYFGEGDDINSTYKEANPKAQAYNNLSLNLNWNMKKLYSGSTSKSDVLLNIYVTNLLDEQIYYPEYSRRILNSLPGRAGRAFYVSMKVGF